MQGPIQDAAARDDLQLAHLYGPLRGPGVGADRDGELHKAERRRSPGVCFWPGGRKYPLDLGHHSRLRDHRDRHGAPCIPAGPAAFVDGDEPRRTAAKDLFLDPPEIPYAVVFDDPDRIYGRDPGLVYEPFGSDGSVGDRNFVRIYYRMRRGAGKGQGVRRPETFCAVYKLAVSLSGDH